MAAESPHRRPKLGYARRMLRVTLVSWLLGSLLVACTNDEGPRAYATYQECFDDQTETQKKPVEDAIVTCCLEHPIDGQSPACGDATPDCINYLTINLKQTSAGVDEMANACMTYETKKDMQKK